MDPLVAELSRAAEGLDRLDGERIVFLVGAPRSGTTWLQRLLATHPRVRTGQESGVFGAYLGPLLRTYREEVERRTRPGLAARPGVGLGAYLYEEDVVRAARFVVAQMLAAAGVQPGEVFLEKSPRHAKFVPEIRAVLPEARVVYIHRDPRDVIGSILVASRSWGRDWAPGSAQGAVNKWARAVRAVRRAQADVPPDRFVEVAYSELKGDPAATALRVVRALGLEWSPAEAAAAAARNDAAGVQAGDATPIPLYGPFRAHFGPVVEEPRGFAGGSRRGRGWGSLSRRTRALAWRYARGLAAEEGYPASFREWVLE